MSMRSSIAFVFTACAAVSLAACGPGNDPANEPTDEVRAVDATAPGSRPATTEPAGVIDATRVVDRAPVADAAPGFDVKAFAGVFVAEGARLQLATDGTYAFTVHAESAGADLVSTGTWTVEAGGGEVLLDPDSKAGADQRFKIVSADRLVAVVGGRVLRRDGA